MVRTLTIAVEGAIGAGKSTFLKEFERHDFHVIREPIRAWTNLGGFNLLDLLYEDPGRWATCFQSYAILTMLKAHTKSTEGQIRMMERSIFSSRFVFTKLLKNLGHIKEPEFHVLEKWFEFVDDMFHPKLDLIIYLRSTPEMALRRVTTRACEEESGMSIEYMQQVHDLYEKWLLCGDLKCRIITIDADVSKECMKTNVKMCIKAINEYFN